MRLQDTILRLFPWQRAVLDADIPADAMLEWRRRPRRGLRIITSHPSTGNAVRGFSGHAVVDEFPIIVELMDYLPGGDYPLTYEQALDQAKQGNMVECNFGNVRYLYHDDGDCLLCIDMEQPSDVERCCGWRTVPPDNN
jgi:hypothetical protein